MSVSKIPSRFIRAATRASATSVCRAVTGFAVRTVSRWSATSLTARYAVGRPAVGWRFYSVNATVEEPLETFDFEKLNTLIKEQPEDYIVIDAREPGELVQTGTIPTALNIPIASSPDSFQIHPEDFEDRFGFERPEKNKTLVFFCKAGVRSHAAAKLARDAGWRTAEYPGSWVDWVAKGGDITHSYN